MKKDISIVIPAINEAENISSLIDKTKEIIENLGVSYEIIIIDGGSMDNTASEATEHGATALEQRQKGFGAALKQGISAATGDFIITMDADFSHSPEYIYKMWSKRKEADMIVASRYIYGGEADMPWLRRILSIALNRVFTALLSLPFKDVSSGFRMYRADILEAMEINSHDFDIQVEIFIKFYLKAFEILEIPFCYKPRKKGHSHVRLLRFAISYARTLFSMWQLRNSVFSADYDSRAYDSKIPLQKYWQRRRFSIIKGFIGKIDNNILDIGCGSSRIIKSLPNAIGFDIKLKVLRHLRRTNTKLVRGTLQNLCFKKGSFDLVIISEVIEHVPKKYFSLSQIKRVLKQNGIIIIGTPDYASIIWRILEYFYNKLLPHAHGKEHISRYTFYELKRKLETNGFNIIDYKYICLGELIIKAERIE